MGKTADIAYSCRSKSYISRTNLLSCSPSRTSVSPSSSHPKCIETRIESIFMSSYSTDSSGDNSVIYNVEKQKENHRAVVDSKNLSSMKFDHWVRKGICESIIAVGLIFGVESTSHAIQSVMAAVPSVVTTVSSMHISLENNRRLAAVEDTEKAIEETEKSIEDTVKVTENAIEKKVDEELREIKRSPGYELARQKRNVAIKSLEKSKVLEVRTDDNGSQTLVLPWMPGTQLPYKSLQPAEKLRNEVLAGKYISELEERVQRRDYPRQYPYSYSPYPYPYPLHILIFIPIYISKP